jgi:hypothetical protein
MRSSLCLALLAGLCTATVAFATDPPQQAAKGDSHDIAGLGRSIDSSALAKMSGGADVSSTMTLTGTVSNNVDENIATGFNEIASGSFSGASGVPMVIQNTGNNVLIQNATIINVQFQP